MDILQRRALKRKYSAVFGSPEGRDVLLDLCKRAGVFKTSVVAGSQQLTNVNEGKRWLALSILGFLNKDEHDMLKTIEGELA